jgi:hypothetical protein
MFEMRGSGKEACSYFREKTLRHFVRENVLRVTIIMRNNRDRVAVKFLFARKVARCFRTKIKLTPFFI